MGLGKDHIFFRESSYLFQNENERVETLPLCFCGEVTRLSDVSLTHVGIKVLLGCQGQWVC